MNQLDRQMNELDLDQRSNNTDAQTFDCWQPNQLQELVDGQDFVAAKVMYINQLGYDNVFTWYGALDQAKKFESIAETLVGVKSELDEALVNLS